jgi:hypothetical protein
MAAVLAGGPGALLSGRAAAYLLGLLKKKVPAPEVITPKVRRARGVRLRTCSKLHPGDRTRARGIPVTTVAFTIVQLAGELGLDDLARACHEAGVRYRTTPRQVDVVLARHPYSPGAAKLRLVLHGDVHVTLSKLERRFLQLLREEGLVLPVTNRPAGSHRVDCRWPERRLTVELDSFQCHNSRHAWRQDRRREREARERGDDHRRYIWEDVFEYPGLMLAELRSLLAG